MRPSPQPSQFEFEMGSFRSSSTTTPPPSLNAFVPATPFHPRADPTRQMGSFRKSSTAAGPPPSLNAFIPASPFHPRADPTRQMGSFRHSAPPDFRYPLTLGVSVISVLRLAALLLLFATAAAAAADRAPDSPVYSRRVWQSADGLPEDYAQALAQTADGSLWIGTGGGLVRFDGTRFTVFNHENEPAFRDDSVYYLYTSRDSTLWIGSEGGGLIRYRDGAFRAYGAAQGLTNGFVRVIFEDKDRNLWVGTDAGLFRMRQE